MTLKLVSIPKTVKLELSFILLTGAENDLSHGILSDKIMKVNRIVLLKQYGKYVPNVLGWSKFVFVVNYLFILFDF